MQKQKKKESDLFRSMKIIKDNKNRQVNEEIFWKCIGYDCILDLRNEVTRNVDTFTITRKEKHDFFKIISNVQSVLKAFGILL